jgi:hypothetical protein
MPITARNASSCQYSLDRPIATLDRPMRTRPHTITRRAPTRSARMPSGAFVMPDAIEYALTRNPALA